MPASERRNEVVDLTADDANDDRPVIYDPTYGPSYLKVPIPGTSNFRPAITVPRSQPNDFPGILGPSVSQSPPQNAYTSGWQLSSYSAPYTNSVQSNGVARSNHAWHKDTYYVPLQQTIGDGAADVEISDRGEKRRKTSEHGQAIIPDGLPMRYYGTSTWQQSYEKQEETTKSEAHVNANLTTKRLADGKLDNETCVRPSRSSLGPQYRDNIYDHAPASSLRVYESDVAGHSTAGLAAHTTDHMSVRQTSGQLLVPRPGTASSVHYQGGLLKICSHKLPKSEAEFKAMSEHYSRESRGSVNRIRKHGHDTDRGSVMSRPSPHSAEKKHAIPSIPRKSSAKNGASFLEEEEHLLIFLKEVKMLKWSDITKEFERDIPGRPYHTLQSRYSTKINKRDRSLDPPVLKLPARWANEAVIDWATVHASTAGPRERAHLDTAPLLQRQMTEEVESASDDINQRQARFRRAPVVNYDVRHIKRHYETEILDEATHADTPEYVADLGHATRSVTPEATGYIPGPAIAVENNPVEVDFDVGDADFALPLKEGAVAGPFRPYLSADQRNAIQNPSEDQQWDQLCSRQVQGAVIHIDFSSAEMKIVNEVMKKIIRSSPKTSHNTPRRRLRTLLRHLSRSKELQTAHLLRKRLLLRNSESIEAFLDDARAGKVAETPVVLRLAAARKPRDMSSINTDSTTAWVLHREVGTSSKRGWRTASRAVTYQRQNKVIDTLGPALSWAGASSDIHTVAWSPYGDWFAAGAVAVTDADSQQYNRPNNLLFGSLMNDTIHELAEHNIQRERTENGANSTHAMFASQDPKLYTTVTAVAFSPSGKLMYSGGYDNQVCVWDLDSPQPRLASKLQHKAKVELMVVNDRYDGVLATAAQKTDGKAVKVIRIDEKDPTTPKKTNFYSEKAVSRSDLNILPQALQFEPTAGRLLLCGFGANVRADSRFDLTGDLCLWDIETGSQLNIHGSNRNVFDVTFNPNRRHLPLFAAGCVANGNVNRRTRSVIRLYDERTKDKFGCPLEIECKALDMNDVVWCPYDEQLLAAGCTDGRVYVWDIRRSDEPLRTLSHGQSLMPLQDGVPHERTDTGVRFLSWGNNATRLYSGSTDGVVKVWDVTRSAEDTFIKDLVTLDSGIMAGKFSPEYDKIILGEVNGSINVLDVGRSDSSIREAKHMRHVPYNSSHLDEDESMALDGGYGHTGNRLLQSQQLSIAPLGDLPVRQVVQGPNYQGPYDQSVDAPFLREQALHFQLSMTPSSAPQCNILACNDSLIKVTNEDIGDSKRSEDRIPDTLRKEWLNVDEKTRILPGRTKCTQCGRSARPPGPEDPVETHALCERCSFSCFRCGAPNAIAPATTRFTCNTCAGVWDIGSLGYECVTESKIDPKLDVPKLRRFGREMLEERTEEEEASFGDEMNALTDYYFSLAIDRPESPPL